MKARNINGFTDTEILNLTIQQSLLLDSNTDMDTWEIREEEVTSNLEFNRKTPAGDSTSFYVTPNGDVNYNGVVTFYGGLALLGDLDATDNDLLNVNSITGNSTNNLLTLDDNVEITGDLDMGNNAITYSGGLGNAKIEGNVLNSGRVGFFNATGTEVLQLPTSSEVVISQGVDLNVDNNTLFVDASANNVGIGTNTPVTPLDVVGDINTSTDYNIGGTQVLSSTTLGSGVVNSSLTNVGTLTSLTMGGDIDMDNNRILISGNVGIGTNNPTSSLHIKTIETTTPFAVLENTGATSSNDTILEITSTPTGGNPSIRYISNQTFSTGYDRPSSEYSISLGNDLAVNKYFTIDTSGNVDIPNGDLNMNDNDILNVNTITGHSTNNLLTIDETDTYITGNVGIGTDTPLTKLDVRGAILIDSQNKIYVPDTDVSFQINGEAEHMVFRTSNNNVDNTNGIFWQNSGAIYTWCIRRSYDAGINSANNNSLKFEYGAGTDGTTATIPNVLVLDEGGNIGIGTNNPSTPLDVVGDINTSTDYNIGGIQVLNSTTLGSGVVNSSLTNLGTLTSLTMGGDINVVNNDILNVNTITGHSTNNLLTIDETDTYITGNVGIGINNPSTKLDVAGDINTSTDYNIGGTQVLSSTTLGSGVVTSSLTKLGTQDQDLNFAIIPSAGNIGINIEGKRISTTQTMAYITFSNYNNNLASANKHGLVGCRTNNTSTNIGDLYFATYPDGSTETERMRIKSDGNVGIGTLAPTQKLQVQGDALIQGGDLYLVDTNEKIASDGTDMFFHVGGSEVVRFEAGGNVGIGNTNPAYPLEVTGNAKVSNLLVGGATTTPGGSGIHVYATNSNHPAYLSLTHVDTGEATTNGLFMSVDNTGTNVSINNQENGYMNFYTNNTERMRILAGGNVGIGTNNPGAFLHIEDQRNSSGGAVELLRLAWTDQSYDTVAGDGTKISFHTSNVNNGAGTEEGASIASVKSNNTEADPSNDLIFSTNNGTSNAQKMKIHSNGNVRIGTGDADYPFHTQSTEGNSLAIMGYFKNGTGGTGAGTQVRIDSTTTDKGLELTQTSPTYTTSLPYKQDCSTIRALNDELIIATNDVITGTIRLITGAGTDDDKTLIFDPNGRVGIGTTSATAKLEVESATAVLSGRFYRKTTDVTDHVLSVNSNVTSTKQQHFRVYADGDVENTNGTYGTISDRKFKKDIIDASSQWEDIKNVRFRKYKLIDGDESEKLGVIAQELQTTSPGLVKTNIDDNDEEYLSVKQSVIFMKGMVALQEALLRIETLEREIDILKRRP